MGFEMGFLLIEVNWKNAIFNGLNEISVSLNFLDANKKTCRILVTNTEGLQVVEFHAHKDEKSTTFPSHPSLCCGGSSKPPKSNSRGVIWGGTAEINTTSPSALLNTSGTCKKSSGLQLLCVLVSELSAYKQKLKNNNFQNNWKFNGVQRQVKY